MINVLIATDFKMICKGRDVYLKDTTYNTLKRYKKAFGTVTLCTRAYQNDSTEGFVLANDVVDNYIPITNLLNNLIGKHDKDIEVAVNQCDLVVARVPSIIAYKAATISKNVNKPLFSVAIGCAWDAYWNHAFPGKIIAPYMYKKMKWCMKKTDYALYVTEQFLQNRYPTNCESIGVSDVVIGEIDRTVIEKRYKKIESMDFSEITVMTSGSVGNKAKGQEYMIKAIPLLNKKGIKVNYLLAGAESPAYLEKIAKQLHVEEQVRFLGLLSTDEVFSYLDKTDIYVQPSLQEGLPRAVVEAMSRGCPVIGARTGGIPELLPDNYIVNRKSSKQIATKIEGLLSKDRMIHASKKNFERATDYNEHTLSARRNEYYSKILSNITAQK